MAKADTVNITDEKTKSTYSEMEEIYPETPDNGETHAIGKSIPQNGSENNPQETIGFSGGELPEQHSISLGISQSNMVQQAQTLASHERVVNNFSDLRDALSKNNGVTTIYLGANIVVDRAAGVHIHDSKTNVTVSGINPLDINQTTPYTLTDYSSATFTDTIYVNSAGVKSLHVLDLKITGKNFYGPFSVLESALTDSLVVTYERVDYNGPQIGHHRRGRIRFIDCTIRIHGENGGSAKQEFAEAKHLQFGGKNIIDTSTSAYSTFWHPTGGSFEILKDSSLLLTASNMGTAFGLFYADGGIHDVDITIGQHAVFDASISGTVSIPAQVTIDSLTVEMGGAFHLTTTKAAADSVMVMGGDLIVEESAAFTVNGFEGGSYAVLEQRSGNIFISQDATFQIVATGPYGRLLDLRGTSLLCDDPANVLLYNPAGRDIRAVSDAGRIHVDAEQINYWTVAKSGGFDDPPLLQWKKADGANFWIDGIINDGDSGNFSSISSNYSSGDPPGTAPTAVNFSMVNARVLAFGRLELQANTPADTSDAITGITSPGAAVRATYMRDGVSHTTDTVSADSNGSFRIPLDMPFTEPTDITVHGNFQFLTATATVRTEHSGKVGFIVPNRLNFISSRLAPKTQTIQRLENNWNILVSDTRGAGSSWNVYVRVIRPLTHNSLPHTVLRNSLVFADENGTLIPLDMDNALLIHQHTTGSINEITTIEWAKDRGILIHVLPGTVSSGTYTADIEWILTDAP